MTIKHYGEVVLGITTTVTQIDLTGINERLFMYWPYAVTPCPHTVAIWRVKLKHQ